MRTAKQDKSALGMQSVEEILGNNIVGFVGGLLCGAALGAGLIFILDPISGRRRRSMVQNKVTKVTNDLGRMADRQGRHLRNKAQGMKSKVFGGQQSSDQARDQNMSQNQTQNQSQGMDESHDMSQNHEPNRAQDQSQSETQAAVPQQQQMEQEHLQ